MGDKTFFLKVFPFLPSGGRRPEAFLLGSVDEVFATRGRETPPQEFPRVYDATTRATGEGSGLPRTFAYRLPIDVSFEVGRTQAPT